MSLTKYKQVISKDFTKDVDFISKTINQLNLDNKSVLLDIGTGIGAMSILLAIKGFNVLTGEPETHHKKNEEDHHNHEEHQELFGEGHHEHFNCDWKDWRESAKEIGVYNKIKYQHFDAESLPFSEKTFDGIFLYDSLQHIKNRKLAIEECLRVTKSNGIICVIEWNQKSIDEEYDKYGYNIEYLDPREILNRDDTSTEIFKGKYLNIFVILKNNLIIY